MWQNNAFDLWLKRRASPKVIPIQEVEPESAADSELSGGFFPREYKGARHELAVVGKLILTGTRIVMPWKLRSLVLGLAHEGHQGIVKTKQ